MSLTGKHRLGSLSGVSAPYTAYIERRTDSGTLQCGVSLLTLDLPDIKESLVFVHIERGTRQHGTLLTVKLHHLVIESWNGYASVFVNE